jgi:hypothetical protein
MCKKVIKFAAFDCSICVLKNMLYTKVMLKFEEIFIYSDRQALWKKNRHCSRSVLDLFPLR